MVLTNVIIYLSSDQCTFVQIFAPCVRQGSERPGIFPGELEKSAEGLLSGAGEGGARNGTVAARFAAPTVFASGLSPSLRSRAQTIPAFSTSLMDRACE